MRLGEINSLTILRQRANGLYLDGAGQDILLPNKYVPESFALGDIIDVFIYRDSEDRLIATTITPKVLLHQFAALRVKDCTRIGAFLDWGLEKDLLLPRNEQARRIQPEQLVVVYLFIDETTDRLTASTNVQDFVSYDVELEQGAEVELLAVHQSELGMQVIVDNRYLGMVYHNEIFQPINEGDTLTGYVKRIRHDGKLDVSLDKPGYEKVEATQQKILDAIKANGGKLLLTDKSSPAQITKHLQMSKRVFKQSVGALYKKRLIKIMSDKIVLNEQDN